jgi:hypothetical protein
MTDEQLVAAFEACELSGEEFSHAAHVRVAWWYLRTHGFDEALQRFRTTLLRFAASQGATGKYHETITVAYMALIADRLRATPELPWPEFVERHPDLLARTPSILAGYYSDEALRSERARREFVAPDRHALPEEGFVVGGSPAGRGLVGCDA